MNEKELKKFIDKEYNRVLLKGMPIVQRSAEERVYYWKLMRIKHILDNPLEEKK
jgi:hypothetical protein